MVEKIYDAMEMREAYCEALIVAAEKDERITCIDCDLSLSMGTRNFAAKFPERSFNMGIQEANACCVAAGMATTGLVPFVHSLAVFSTRRICDQVFLSCSYAGLNVKIIGGDSGVAAAFNGGTHMAFEDIAIMRSIPEITILEPTDTVMMKALVPKIAETYGVFYVRYVRRKVKHVYDDGETFEIGKAKVLRDGKDITLIASGLTVAEAKEAAEILKNEGIEARVVDMFTIKPIDVACILESAQKTGAILTVENHNVIGGLGSAVAEVLSENCPTPLLRMGIQEEFGEVGTQDYLMERYHLTAAHIVRRVKEFLKKAKGKNEKHKR